MNWSDVANEIGYPVIATGALFAAAGMAFGLNRFIKSKQDRSDYGEADKIMQRAPKITRIRIPGYSDDPR